MNEEITVTHLCDIESCDIESELDHAIKSQAFSLVYQPIVDLGNNKIVGLEALIRWKSDKFGSMSPEAFIPIAEKTGHIIPISKWALQHCCQQLHQWQQQGLTDFYLSVNLSPLQLLQDNLLETIDQILTDSAINKHHIRFELTETSPLRYNSQLEANLNGLLDHGFKLAIDDFGTGYSSLARLKKIAFSIVKIDRSFIEDLENSALDQKIVESVIYLAKKLDLSLVAEGISNPQHCQFLRNHGCPFGQGHFFSPPVSAKKMTQLLKKD